MKIKIESINKHLVLNFAECEEIGDYYREDFNPEDTIELYRKIIDHLVKNDAIQKVAKEDKAYSEEISTHLKEVERSLSINKTLDGKMSLQLICYTDKNDDHWIRLTVSKAAELAGLISGYITESGG
ncbi:hypothetical protein [Oceanobacillus kimchii]|uniref:Uncharacterized protein n=1 Tax=Oceanobacillus kimchii TaxID=746691 RepID=A0ABQ5TNP3_9BACI|nr:hypothetical protein [Oceanobacillus kimchii]GLO66177.1 hypothetical protein MACH08_19610 [Oceanobacillus kimchii]